LIDVDKNKGDVHDPDKVLSYEREGFNTNNLEQLANIFPREDLMAFTHKETTFTIDFGYYGCEIELDGYWVVYVINGNIDEPWYSPIERHESKIFLEDIKVCTEHA
jgi:hypothetical protein